MLTGKHLLNGHWVDGGRLLESSLQTRDCTGICQGTAEQVDIAANAAEAAFASYALTSRAERGAFLDRIADELEQVADQLTEVGVLETGLPEGRLIGERGRTTAQLRMFARHIESGEYLDRRHDHALPDRAPAPRPELHMVQRPVGPVAVFGAANFPLAFSVAGGDTASALAAGCPVVVKGHPAHPGTGELAARAVDQARKACDLHPGVFSFVQAGNRQAGAALVQHRLIRAVGFTGSLSTGRILFDLCAARPEPIPFFGELGSINPVFVLERALQTRSAAIAKDWADSLTLGAGQFCTNPGVVVLLAGEAAVSFAQSTVVALQATNQQKMLTGEIARAYSTSLQQLTATDGVESLCATNELGQEASPALFRTSGDTFLANSMLAEEVFGPAGLIVEASNLSQVDAIAAALEGQLTVTLQIEPEDQVAAQRLLQILERKAGRLLVNGFPTGVEVCDAMSHGGPYPASTNFGATSVGTMAIRRFLRPVCYQNVPRELLPGDLLAE